MNDIMEQLCGKIGDADYQKKSVIVQGITGKFGSRHTKLMLEYGTNIVAGVTPGKGGTKFENIPIYENMSDAIITIYDCSSMSHPLLFWSSPACNICYNRL